MFGQVPPTPYDITFSLFGIPIRVHPMFWLIAVVLGWAAQRPDLIVIWVMCLFLSILVHELGHALMSRAFGNSPHIVLYHMGGYAAYQPTYGHSYWKSIAILIAGPFAGFLLYGVSKLIAYLYFQANVIPTVQVQFALIQLEWINLIWGFINLLPVYPLDGGQILRDVLSLLRLRGALTWTFRVGFLCAILVAILFLQRQAIYPAVFFGFLAAMNFKLHEESSRY
ncbi:MAG: site-2 protease family protein [Planctomycetaceae bacterium]|nr:site-2 protease family protein [Planctomycetaceae bacterium]